jgi:hypothetical protein
MAGPASAACNADMLTMTSWSIKPIDAQGNELKVTLNYTGTRAVKMIDASFGFRDALGGHIASAAIDRDAKIGAGAAYVQTGLWGPYTFERLLKLDHADVQPFTCVKSVLYADGQKEEFK